MLVNILFIRKPTMLGLFAGFFSTERNRNLLPIQRFEKYYKPKMKQFDSLAKSILQTMASANCNKSVLKNILQNYREVEYRRHPLGLVTVICAINECKDFQIREFGRHMVQFIIRANNLSMYVCDAAELTALLAQFAVKRSQSFEKIKQTIVKYKIAELVQINHAIIAPTHFHDIINLLTSNDRLTVTTTNRFVRLATMLKQKILEFMKDYLKNDHFSYGWIVTQQFVGHLFYFFKDYPTQTNEQAKILFQFVDKTVFSQKMSLKKMTGYSIHRHFPYDSRSPEGEYYKDIILRRIIERSRVIKDEGEGWNEGLLCYSILSFEFYKSMDNIQFRYQSDLNYLKKEDLKIPQLPTFYWQKYEADPRVINKDHIARNIIKCVYPQRYRSTPDLETSTIKPPKITENEIKIRTVSALELLGLKWKREVEVSGRYVDFLVDDIIIECDGDYHFDLHKMDYNESTQFRNLHLLLSGYKLLIFNIFQYNRHRTTEALAELIKRKLEVLRKNDGVMIV